MNREASLLIPFLKSERRFFCFVVGAGVGEERASLFLVATIHASLHLKSLKFLVTEV